MYFNKFILKRNQVCALKIWNANQINFQIMRGDINFKKQLQQQTQQNSQFSKRLEKMWGKREKHEKHKTIPILHNSN